MSDSNSPVADALHEKMVVMLAHHFSHGRSVLEKGLLSATLNRWARGQGFSVAEAQSVLSELVNSGWVKTRTYDKVFAVNGVKVGLKQTRHSLSEAAYAYLNSLRRSGQEMAQGSDEAGG
ncbi:MAG: hypothetical protein M1357_01775 [Candidatus Marsarchaeota archaeon]|nr:hypothetical protein [Candidatus Marsarchaeota archaeon]